MQHNFMRSWQTLMDDLDGTSSTTDSSDNGSSSRGTPPLFGRSWRSLEELEAHIEQQLRELAPPEIVTWLQDFERQARQHQQQQQQELLHGSKEHSAGGASLKPAEQQAPAPQQQQQPWQQPAARAAVHQLQQLGAQVYLPTAAALASSAKGSSSDGDGADGGWGSLAGYESQKQALEDYLLLPLKHPEVGSAGGAGC
jgi:hypothetical protein